jgi:Ca-activated chloride channel homolog
LPAQDLRHPQLPRLWAKERVQALLAKIAERGEDSATIEEIIRLSRRYKFVTPYTSFLAVPRALLRPRVIRPGDPVLRVKTDPSIDSVFALFPFGLIKPLRYLRSEDIWETRFVAPPGLSDGTYRVRLILRDRDGHVYRESKTFVIISRPPLVRVRLPKYQFRVGDLIPLRVSASSYTRYVVAEMEGAPPVELHWNASARANIGAMQVPDSLPPGKYTLHVTAEDIAHNIGSSEVAIDVVP